MPVLLYTSQKRRARDGLMKAPKMGSGSSSRGKDRCSRPGLKASGPGRAYFGRCGSGMVWGRRAHHL